MPAKGESLEHERDQQDGVRGGEVRRGRRMGQFLDPLVDGQQTAGDEDTDGSDERPEVGLTPVSQWVALIGRTR